ncbi:nicotinate-nucleotide adenylyltransferase [Granulibacter bethesdensis]|uniref:nicotinate-nucleotide adenylyltransferase n=1 Tax=Granulibacter bethesdensis TaxID=364410 RepID=UPI0003F214F2|nr:nicotinate-nucleotide adenylyltransferase [Granulibacter bethesdensis]AHJ65814.1 Nicotinate-nucleotide adenylyltransferase [Granulibacter bethesdensis CGDNIH4]
MPHFSSTPVPDPLPRFGDRRRIRIGLLGGSFNPAHAGHALIARHFRQKLRLHQVWLMVSPGNPLKSGEDMAPLAARLASARAIADGRHIIATTIESRLGTRYTADTLARLRTLFPCARFVWLMGADNLAGFPRWRDWRGIAADWPFALHPRPGYTARALSGQAASVLRRYRRPEREAPLLADLPPPAWMMLRLPQSPLSATQIRAGFNHTLTGLPSTARAESGPAESR